MIRRAPKPGRAAPRLAIIAAVLSAASAAPAAPYAYVAVLGADEVAVIDTATNAVVTTLPGGDDPNGVAISPDGTRAYVTNFLSNTLTAIDTTSNAVIGTVAVGDGPVGVAVHPDGQRLYVANRRADTLSVLDATPLAERTQIAVGNGPNAVAVSPDGATAYVTNSETSAPGLVSVIDLASESVRATLAVHRSPNRVAFTPDGRTAYVTNFHSWNATVIDATTDTAVTALRLGYRPSSVVVNPNGAWAYVTDLAAGLAVIDVAAQRVTRSLPVGRRPWAVALQRNGGTGYVANFYDDSITVLDLGDEVAVAEVPVGDRPFAVAVNCVGDGCTEAPYTPKPTRTPTVTPSEPPTPPTPTPTAVPILLRGNQVAGSAGERVTISVTLQTNGHLVAGTRNDIDFQPDVRVVARPDGSPDCQVNPTIDKPSTAFAFQPIDCTGSECSALRALVLSLDNTNPIPDGSVLYSCGAEIAPEVLRGRRTLGISDRQASTPDGRPLLVDAVPVAVDVAGPAAVVLRGGAASGRPGERVSLSVALDTTGPDVAGVQNDIVFTDHLRIAARANGRPDCAVNPSIEKPGTSFGFQPSGCSGSACTALRVLVLALDNVDPIADGAVLYTCAVEIAADAPIGASPLSLSNLGSSDPDGNPLDTGATDPVVTVLGALLQRIGAGAGVCSAGANDGTACAADADCPAGACVRTQGMCDGGADTGLLCDCPGSSCVATTEACGGAAEAGTCAGGDHAGECCDRSFNCGRDSACVATHRLCASGASKGSPCVRDGDCVASTCVAAGRRCSGGTLDGTSCIDSADCPAGTCSEPNAPPPSPTRTASPAAPTPTATLEPINAGSGSDSGGCATVPPRGSGGALWLLAPVLIFWRRRR